MARYGYHKFSESRCLFGALLGPSQSGQHTLVFWRVRGSRKIQDINLLCEPPCLLCALCGFKPGISPLKTPLNGHPVRYKKRTP